MKSNEFLGLLINPFRKVAGWQAFGLGLVFVGVMGVVGTLAHVAFDGALDMHLTENLTYAQSFLYLGISVASVVLVLWLAGLMIASAAVQVYGQIKAGSDADKAAKANAEYYRKQAEFSVPPL